MYFRLRLTRQRILRKKMMIINRKMEMIVSRKSKKIKINNY